MNDDLGAMRYFMAAEKVAALIFSIEMTMEFIDEFKIDADDSVKAALNPQLDKLKDWIK